MDEEVDVLETLEDFRDEFGSLIDEPPMAGIFSADSLLSLTRVTSVGAEQKESPKSVFHEDSSSPYGVSASMLLGGKPIAQPPQNVMKLPSEGIKQQDNKPKQQPQLLRRPTPAFNIDFIAGSTRPITSFGQPTIIGNTPPSPSSSDKTEVKEKPDWAKSSEALDNEMRRRLEQAAEDTSKQKQKYVVDKQTLICHLAWCSRAKEIPKERQIRVDKVPYNGHYALCTTCFRSKTPEYQLNEFLKASKPSSKSELISRAIVAYCERLGIHAEVKGGVAYITTMSGEWFFTYNDRPIVLHHKNAEKRYDWKGNLLKNNYHTQEQKFYSPAHALAYIAIHDKPERALAIGLQQLEAMKRSQQKKAE